MTIPPFFRGPAVHSTDYGSGTGAEKLAKLIMQAWRDAGYPNVLAWPDLLPDAGPQSPDRRPRFSIKTNLVGGLPPGRSA